MSIMMSERDIRALWLRARRSAEQGNDYLSGAELHFLEEVIMEMPERKQYQRY